MTGLLALILNLLPLFATSAASISAERNIAESIDPYVNSNPDSAIILCNEALRDNSHRSDTYLRSQLFTVRGNAAFTLGNHRQAIDDFTEAVRLARLTADTLLCVNALSDLGVAYRVNQQPDSALIFYNMALEMADGHDMPDMESSILTSIAVLFAHQRRLDEAIPFAEKGLEKANLTDDIETQIYAASTLGSALFLAGKHDRSLETQRAIVKVAERKGVPRYILKTYASIIAMHNRLGNTDSVSHYINLGRELLPKVPEASVESIGFMDQSSAVLTDMGRYRESLDLQMKILAMNDSRPFLPLNLLWQRIAHNYKGLGDIEKMDEAYTNAIAIADSIHQSDIDEQISDFNVRYRTAEKELAIANLEAEKSHRDTLLTIITAVLLIAVTALFFYLRYRRRKIELDTICARLDGIEQERGRLAHELHDGVCNDLFGIELTLASGHCDNRELSAMISNTRKEVRAISHELLPPNFNGLSLTQLLADYAQKSDGFVTFQTSGHLCDLAPQDSMHLYRITQEWIANLRRHSSATCVTLTLTCNGTSTVLEIADNGQAFDPATAPSSGLGIENINRRVKALRANCDFSVKNGLNLISVKIF